jgi:acyl-CoA synthetase (AMP-forming)/AMP-acid ligase II
MHAGYWAGAVPAPVNYRLAPPEIAYVLDNAECELLIVEDIFGARNALGYPRQTVASTAANAV